MLNSKFMETKMVKKKVKKLKFGNVEWRNKYGKNIPLYKMKREHLESIKKFLQNCKQEMFNNIHKSIWLIEIDQVLEWRKNKYKQKIEKEISNLEKEISDSLK